MIQAGSHQVTATKTYLSGDTAPSSYARPNKCPAAAGLF